ncbi:RNA-DNA hybrid ribonuclease [Trebouxia sp. C0010 RCD-2024]
MIHCCSQGITAEGIQSVADALYLHTSVNELILAHNSLGDKGVMLLEPALRGLRMLDLRHCCFGGQGTSHLAAVLKHAHCKLEVLRLDGNKVSGGSLSRGLLGNESLRELHLAHTDIGDEGLDNLCTVLPAAKTLAYLDISSCNIQRLSGLTLVVADAFHGIQDKAMLQEEFHGAIPDCAAHLQVLKLRDNGLSDEELQGLGEALQENSLLQDLDLAGNQVYVQTLQSLAPATVLQKLCLFNCKMDQEAAEQVVASLEAGGYSNLQELDLSGNNIEAAQMQALLQSLQHQDRAPALKVLILGGNPAGHSTAFEEHVAKARAARPSLDIAWQANDPGQTAS